jgi:hypothetical protein
MGGRRIGRRRIGRLIRILGFATELFETPAARAQEVPPEEEEEERHCDLEADKVPPALQPGQSSDLRVTVPDGPRTRLLPSLEGNVPSEQDIEAQRSLLPRSHGETYLRSDGCVWKQSD